MTGFASLPGKLRLRPTPGVFRDLHWSHGAAPGPGCSCSSPGTPVAGTLGTGLPPHLGLASSRPAPCLLPLGCHIGLERRDHRHWGLFGREYSAETEQARPSPESHLQVLVRVPSTDPAVPLLLMMAPRGVGVHREGDRPWETHPATWACSAQRC